MPSHWSQITAFQVEDAYLVALNKADTMMERERGPLEGVGRFRDMFKTLIDVGRLVAEVNLV